MPVPEMGKPPYACAGGGAAAIERRAEQVPAVWDFGMGCTRSVLGVSVASLGWEEALSQLAGFVRDRRFTKVTFLNAHNANIASVDDSFAGALDDFLVLPDGIGVDIAAMLLYGRKFPANLNGTDFVPDLLMAIKEPLTVGLLGATRANAEGAGARLRQLVPQHRIVVFNDGFFSPTEEARIVQQLAEHRPDILLVAMGVPRQELWIARNLDHRHCTLPLAVGALFDFLSGAVPRAPLWLRRLRLEWAFRLAVEPGRMWRRYLIGNPLFLCRVIRQKRTASPVRITR